MILIVGGVIIAILLLKRVSFISPAMARELLLAGAKVIDVRTEAEFRENHITGAINVPLDRLKEEIARVAPDREKPLLVHCQSGGRSGIGKQSLKSIGYKQVYNLGGYGRAESIVSAARKGE
jgi:phage shock protein E